MTSEGRRLEDARDGVPWRTWGPYLSERQWGTVREDYSESGDAWSYLSHDQARSRAYRWGEDGLAGISDDQQRLCFAIALWNERDPILKERLFGLTNAEGNHGEDVKEYYFYVDNVPTHSYQRWLYKYPHAAFPYEDLVLTNRSRSKRDTEYELVDTGVFDEGHYFDVEVEYAKIEPEDLLCRITIHNRSTEPASLHVLPHLWFRNTWSWSPDRPKPRLSAADAPAPVVKAEHDALGDFYLYVGSGRGAALLRERVERPAPLGRRGPRLPEGRHRRSRGARRGHGEPGSAWARRPRCVAGSRSMVAASRRCWCDSPAPRRSSSPTRSTTPPATSPFAGPRRTSSTSRSRRRRWTTDSRSVMRQALAGMLWSKQCYYFDLDVWLRERKSHPLRMPTRRGSRNESWFHMINHDVISMPDKWEYPWYAAWDLAFHCIPLAMVDPDFAKNQLHVMLSQLYLHPSGQMPAYEWNFGDVNPPVHAFATLFLHGREAHIGAEDVSFLKESFTRLMLNFQWWVNRKDPSGRNVFEGGFLGLDNIGVFDRSAKLPTGGSLEQADGTAWMAMFSQNMLELALAVAEHDPSYEDLVLKFVEHFFWIAAAVDPIGDHPDELWDEEDGFFYDVLRRPDGSGQRLKVRSLVGLLPMCAVTVVEPSVIARYPRLAARIRDYLERNHDLLTTVADPLVDGVNGRRILSLVNEYKLRRILTRVLDEERFLGPHGIRSISRWHLDNPYRLDVDGIVYEVQYEPAESTTGMFGGNSNWRGPVWFPINLLVVRALLQHYRYYGDSFKIECPTGSGVQMTLFEVAQEVSRRLVSTFLRDADGHRPVYGGTRLFQEDPHWRDLILFYEYFHGDNGAGLGASHQTGWTGVVARLIQGLAQMTPESVLADTLPMSRLYHRPD